MDPRFVQETGRSSVSSERWRERQRAEVTEMEMTQEEQVEWRQPEKVATFLKRSPSQRPGKWPDGLTVFPRLPI